MGIVLEHGFYTPPVPVVLVEIAQALLLAAYVADVLRRDRAGREPVPGHRSGWFDRILFTFAASGVVLQFTGLAPHAWLLTEIAITILFASELWTLNIALSRTLRNPGILFPASFVLLIVLGTLLLKAPVATPPGHSISWLDAAFTMTSAVCVTGLTVRSTAADFTPYGQTVIAVFIQLGGLGFIIFGSTLVMLLGHQLPLRGRRSLSEMLADEPLHRLTSFTRFILLTTLLIELTGALLLYLLWPDPPEGPLTPARRTGLSVFHALSAFYNAGFDLTGQSMIPFRAHAMPYLVIAPLIVLGGLGFPVLSNLASAARARLIAAVRRTPPDPVRARLTLHTKLVLITSAALYIFGVAAISAGQFGVPDDPASGADAPRAARTLADAGFLSISARTAGITTLPMEEIQPASRVAIMALMFVGGSPGGATGGVKTTTLALLVLSVIATVRQRPETEAFGRTIADALVRRAATVAICFVLLVVLVTLLLCLTEPASAGVEAILFETISAASTTGFSLGLTPQLSPIGRAIIMVTMFLGRVGPLVLFASLVFRRGPQRPYAYPHESVALG